MAGAPTAAMLGHAGIRGVLIDPHPDYPADFRCEKLDQRQLALLAKTGVADAVIAAATPSHEVWVARYGHLVEKRLTRQVGALYPALVNAMRGRVGGSVDFVLGKCIGVTTSADWQIVTLASGAEISARVVVLANGLSCALRRNVGLGRHDIAPGHCIAIGFDVMPLDRPHFDFGALTYYPERLGEGIAYLTLFPAGSGMRANLFVYREMRDPWLKSFRDAPVAALAKSLPGLGALLGRFAVSDTVHIRPVDLYV